MKKNEKKTKKLRSNGKRASHKIEKNNNTQMKNKKVVFNFQ